MTTKKTAKQRFINSWKRRNNRKTTFDGRLQLAWKVPGTPEAGQLALYQAQPESVFESKQ